MTAPSRESGAQLHRRETRRQIYLPFGLALLLTAGMIGMVAALNDPLARVRVAIIGNMVGTFLALCPMIVCFIPLYFVLAAAIFGMAKLHTSVGTPLERLERATNWASTQVTVWTDRANQRLIQFGATIAPLMRMFSIFNPPPQETPHGNPKTD
jgi:hypothetical protein